MSENARAGMRKRSPAERCRARLGDQKFYSLIAIVRRLGRAVREAESALGQKLIDTNFDNFRKPYGENDTS